ncbi:MAG: hypothetical protein QM817_05580 [Archangium sp.]
MARFSGRRAAIDSITRALTIGSQFGSWQLWPGYKKWAMAGIWYALMPGITHVIGRFPGSLGIGADLPRGVALEWAKWGRSRDFFLAHGVSRDGYAAMDCPMISISFTDDDYAPKAAVDALHALYVNAKLERRHIAPSEIAVSKIGHFGFFRDQFAPTLWEQVRGFVFDRAAPAGRPEQREEARY